MHKRVLWILILVLAFVLAYFVFQNNGIDLRPGKYSLSPTTSQGDVYENEYFKVSLPLGWTTTPAYDNWSVDGKIEKRVNPAAINIVNGNYILYINVLAGHASGVQGGRFSEVSMGAPSADAVMIEPPAPPCGTQDSSDLSIDQVLHSRFDLYISNQDDNAWCAKPISNASRWYFSYVIRSDLGGYFNYYDKPGQNLSYVITMAYNSRDINSLPVKDSPALVAMLSEMSNIVKSLDIKEGSIK